MASVSQEGVAAAAAVGVVSAAVGPICGKTVPVIFLFFNEIRELIIFIIRREFYCSIHV